MNSQEMRWWSNGSDPKHPMLMQTDTINNLVYGLPVGVAVSTVAKYSGFLPPSKHMHVRFTGDSRSEYAWLALSQLCDQLVTGEPVLRP